jgi:hypothetical protein
MASAVFPGNAHQARSVPAIKKPLLDEKCVTPYVIFHDKFFDWAGLPQYG